PFPRLLEAMQPMKTANLAIFGLTLWVAAAAAQAAVAVPAAVVADGVPAIPVETVAQTRPYLEYRSANFLGWNPADRSMLVKTRFGSTDQLFQVARPDAARRQISFEDEPTPFATFAPAGSPALVVQKDVGG